LPREREAATITSFAGREDDSMLVCHPLTPDRWADFEQLFGERGVGGGCWCMYWRLPRAEYEAQKGAANKDAMKALVDGGETPGLLGYLDGRPVGWCSVAPRSCFVRLEKSRTLRPIDSEPVWSVSCLFVDRNHRRQGVSVALLEEAVAFVRRLGGRVVEGYPVEPVKETVPAVFAWTGLASAFLAAGFVEVARGSETRPIMRFVIEEAPTTSPGGED
jgi:GNAT superfamily N-acetyltransferase